MTIKKLINPLTDDYNQFKLYVNCEEFDWHYIPNSVRYTEEKEGYLNKGYYTKTFLTRPEAGNLLFPKQSSEHVGDVQKVMLQILLANNIKPALFYRMSVNCDHASDSELPNVAHIDHKFPHENLLIYLNDPKEGYTLVEDKKYYGKEDDVILFSGLHCNASPKTGRRLVSIATFLRYE